MKNLELIKYWVLDVDGTMTDGSIYYDESGNELKKFNTKDAAGFFALHALDMKIIVITGRECNATRRRMDEMKVDYIYQNIKNKKEFLETFLSENGILKEEVAYVGDDLNDLSAMTLAGFIACPKDSCTEICEFADYVSSVCGGNGVIRDVVQYILKQRKQWEEAISRAYSL